MNKTGFIHIILSVQKCYKAQSRDHQLRLKRAMAHIWHRSQYQMHQEACFPWNRDAYKLMTKIIFLLKWWCCEVLTWIGTILFVLHWDGNIENVFTTELHLIIQWPRTETFCLAAETKWACQPDSITVCFICLCMKGFWVSFGFNHDRTAAEAG